ncbi:MAG: V4R domain-containing protein [Nanoarchaeota archaeon]
MVLKLPPLVSKVQGLKELKYDSEGSLLLWNTSVIISPVQVNLIKTKLYEEFSETESNKIEYFVGKIQAKTGMQIINKKFGYAKTISDKKKLVIFNNGQFELLGQGRFKIVKQDVKTGTVVTKTKSQYAREYKTLFGVQKKSVDYFMAGLWAGTIEQIYGKTSACIETQCIAKGDEECEFLIKSIENFNQNEVSSKDSFIFEKNTEERIKKSWKLLFS